MQKAKGKIKEINMVGQAPPYKTAEQKYKVILASGDVSEVAR